MTIGMFAKLGTGESVFLEVTDLTTFVHAAFDTDVCVYDQQNNAHMVRKDALRDLAIETSEENKTSGGPPHTRKARVMRAHKRFYIGYANGGRWLFSSATLPTTETHGESYRSVIGPFRTKKGAEFMRDFGAGNPHCQTVADAERLAKKEELKARRVQGGKGPHATGFVST